jgi:hypothetical protein
MRWVGMQSARRSLLGVLRNNKTITTVNLSISRYANDWLALELITAAGLVVTQLLKIILSHCALLDGHFHSDAQNLSRRF